MERVEGLGQIWLAFLAWIACAIARVGTAPLEKVNLFFPARLATNSLQLDYRNLQFVRFVRLAREGIRHGSHSSPSPIIGGLKNTGIPATPRSSFPHIPAPPGFALLSPALP
jgi:hypothetical protein